MLAFFLIAYLYSFVSASIRWWMAAPWDIGTFFFFPLEQLKIMLYLPLLEIAQENWYCFKSSFGKSFIQTEAFWRTGDALCRTFLGLHVHNAWYFHQSPLIHSYDLWKLFAMCASKSTAYGVCPEKCLFINVF